MERRWKADEAALRTLRRRQDLAPTVRERTPTAPHVELRRAAERVLRTWPHSAAAPLLLDEPIEQELGRVVDALEDALHDDATPQMAPVRNPILRRRLLELLHSEVLELWTEQADETPGAERPWLALIRVLTNSRRQLDPEWGQDIPTLLASPDGLRLVAEIAHDLRSPLTAVLFLSDTLRRGHSGPLSEPQLRQMGLIYSATLGLIEVASDMIELARGGEHLSARDVVPFSIRETLESVRGIVEPLAEEKHLQLRLRGAEPDSRMGHPIALNRVLLNLSTNALKFTDHGSVEVMAEVVDRQRLRWSVRDTGPGIPEEARDSLYVPFRVRADSGYHFSGTGLGLTIARRLVRAMGSELSYESSPDWGTRFYFDIEAPPTPRH
ncbi:MAG: sensor histidine kinase [Longimicrobiales bacterium]